MRMAWASHLDDRNGNAVSVEAAAAHDINGPVGFTDQTRASERRLRRFLPMNRASDTETTVDLGRLLLR